MHSIGCKKASAGRLQGDGDRPGYGPFSLLRLFHVGGSALSGADSFAGRSKGDHGSSNLPAEGEHHTFGNQEIQLKLINQLRAEILRALLVANGDKMLAEDIRKNMHIKKNHFAELLRVCDFAETKPFHLDSRQTVIILKSELVPRD